MSVNKTNTYDVDEHIAEIHDQVETQTDDVELIRSLIRGQGRLRILEPFCGTGRILIPLAVDGHELIGLDQSKAMLDRARMKVEQLSESVQKRGRDEDVARRARLHYRADVRRLRGKSVRPNITESYLLVKERRQRMSVRFESIYCVHRTKLLSEFLIQPCLFVDFLTNRA